MGSDVRGRHRSARRRAIALTAAGRAIVRARCRVVSQWPRAGRRVRGPATGHRAHSASSTTRPGRRRSASSRAMPPPESTPAHTQRYARPDNAAASVSGSCTDRSRQRKRRRLRRRLARAEVRLHAAVTHRCQGEARVPDRLPELARLRRHEPIEIVRSVGSRGAEVTVYRGPRAELHRHTARERHPVPLRRDRLRRGAQLGHERCPSAARGAAVRPRGRREGSAPPRLPGPPSRTPRTTTCNCGVGQDPQRLAGALLAQTEAEVDLAAAIKVTPGQY